jgi:hypothetical protein
MAMEMIRETMKQRQATRDAVEMAGKKEEAQPLWQQLGPLVRRKR